MNKKVDELDGSAVRKSRAADFVQVSKNLR